MDFVYQELHYPLNGLVMVDGKIKPSCEMEAYRSSGSTRQTPRSSRAGQKIRDRLVAWMQFRDRSCELSQVINVSCEFLVLVQEAATGATSGSAGSSTGQDDGWQWWGSAACQHLIARPAEVYS